MDDGYVEEDDDDTWSVSSGNSVRKNHAANARRTMLHSNSVPEQESPSMSVNQSGVANPSPGQNTEGLSEKMRWLSTDDSGISNAQLASAQKPINTAKNYIRTIPIPPTPQNLVPQSSPTPNSQQIYMNLPLQQQQIQQQQQRNGIPGRPIYYENGRPMGGGQMIPIVPRDYRILRRIPGEAYPGDLRRPIPTHQLQQMQQIQITLQHQYATLPANMQYHSMTSQLTVQLPAGHSSPQPSSSPTPPAGNQAHPGPHLQAANAHLLAQTQHTLQAATSPPPVVQAAVQQIQNQIALQQLQMQQQQAVIHAAQQQAIQQAQALQQQHRVDGKYEYEDFDKYQNQQEVDRSERIRKRYSVTEEEDPSFGFARRPSVKGIRQRYASQTDLNNMTVKLSQAKGLHCHPVGKGPVAVPPPQPPALPQLPQTTAASQGPTQNKQNQQQQIYQNQLPQGYMTLPAGVSLAQLTGGDPNQMWQAGEQIQLQQMHAMGGHQQLKVMVLPRLPEENPSKQQNSTPTSQHQQQAQSQAASSQQQQQQLQQQKQQQQQQQQQATPKQQPQQAQQQVC
ncbi:putative uncharacterized protein DDB_G0271606 [Galendromus occidentalis]|uniref:Uncharacterized protein n=1 Tax=Galendromus occidentalis TaxID=34638 RepID=A0AAJ7WHX7_9ACAR|nr:putative uncharacterized protein DDB_G0271606 [Galendromus occidentalis]